MEVEADLVLEVDGVTASVVGSGADITLSCPDPARLLDALSHAALPAGVGRLDGPRALGRAGDALRDAGLLLLVTGPNGVILRMGRDTHSVVGAVVTRSTAVRPGAWAATRPLASASLRASAGRHPGRSAGAVAAVAVLVLAGYRSLRGRTTDS